MVMASSVGCTLADLGPTLTATGGGVGRAGGGGATGTSTTSSTGGSIPGDLRLLSAGVPADHTDVVEATFSRRLQHVTTDDFFTNRTHALVKTLKMTGPLLPDEEVREVANEDGSYTYVLQLSDHVVPGETPELIYFQERGDVTDDAGMSLPSFAAPIDVAGVASYDGDKTLLTVSKDGTWNDVVEAMADDTIVRIERGFDGSGGPTSILHDNLTLTAYGRGSDPRVTLSGQDFWSISAIDKNHVTLVGLHLVSDGMNGIAFRDRSSYGAIIGCTFDRLDTKDNAQAAIDFYFPTDSSDGYKRVEGPKALFNTILGHNGGIFFNLSRVARYEWLQRYVEDVDGDGYRQPAMFIGNYIKLRNHGSDKGDAIAVSRADHNWAEVSYNHIEGWVDDGFDAFQGLRVIVEYNTWDQQIDVVAKGGNGIKSGGFGRDDDAAGDSYTSGYSGDIIIRYNVVKNTVTSGGNNPFGINTNGGGGAHGKTNPTLGVTYGKTLIYGNFIYNAMGNAMQMYKADGGDFEVYNNLFISSGGGKGVRFTTSTNPQALIFRNNIVSSAFASDGIQGRHNIWLAEFSADSTYELHATESQHSLASIFDDVVHLSEASVLSDSPSIDAGNRDGLDYPQDGRGHRIGERVDIGPIEAPDGR